MQNPSVKIEASWKGKLLHEFNLPYFQELSTFIHHEYAHKTIYPPPKEIFRALDLCPFEKVKVVILGQDPYHGAGQANGLSFAVHSHVSLPPSLKNIFKEIEDDLQIKVIKDGDLSRWANQGVLLLNAILTVEASSPASHHHKGWELFTDAIIKRLSEEREHIVFILWGNYAKNKGNSIDQSKHLVLTSPHPSPFSAHNGFFGSKPFSKTNEYLHQHNIKEIDWR